MIANQDSKGFTLVELVLTLVLVGILATLGISLFSTKDSFVARTVADQIIAHSHLAQQVALGRHAFQMDGSPESILLNISQSGSTVSLLVSQGSYQSQQTIDAQTVSVAWSTSSTTSCGGGTSLTSSSFSLSFDQQGDTSGNSLICVAGKQTIPVCITRLGFAYEGVCES